MNPAPVTAVIPVRNGAPYIGEALQSVFNQTWRPREVIVIDDGSTDETGAEVGRFAGVTYVRQPPLGIAAARNHGARIASHPYLAFLDADDLWTPRKTEMQLAVLSENPSFDVVFGQMVQFEDTPTGERNVLSQPSVSTLPGMQLIRLEAFWRVGPFSSEWKVGEAVDWWARAVDCGLKATTIDALVLMRRLHGRNIGRTAKEPMKDYLRILHATVKRRRDDQGS